LDEFANRADLATFVSRFRSDASGVTFTTTRVNGGGDDQNDPGVEANLDIQYTIGISFPTPNIYYSTGGSPPFVPDETTPTNTVRNIHFIFLSGALIYPCRTNREHCLFLFLYHFCSFIFADTSIG